MNLNKKKILTVWPFPPLPAEVSKWGLGEKHWCSSEASGCEGSNILGKQREWQKIFPSRETEYFRPVKQNISVPWNRIFLSSGKYPVVEKNKNAPWRKMYLRWQTTFPFCGSTYFYPVAEILSKLKGVVWTKICSALQLFCIKVLRKKRQP